MSNLDRPQSILNIHDYISEKTFVIPNYQRGYKWGVPREEGKCSVQKLLDDIIKAKEEGKTEYFIQGVTVTENNDTVILIDGQQRTTTLYLLLKYLEYDLLPTIQYDIRKETDNFLKDSFIENGELKSTYETNESQDIYYLKKAIKTIHNKLNGCSDNSKKELRRYILEKVKLFYITIETDEATKVFSMLNGQKAKMKQAELIKAELLRLISKNDSSHSHRNNEWEINQARSKYAREWDRWNYWWNREEVRDFYGNDDDKSPINFLLNNFAYFKNKSLDKNQNKSVEFFELFKTEFLTNSKLAKNTFKELREFQKTFEDWFNDYEKHNCLGLIIKCSEVDKQEAFRYLSDKKDTEVFRNYAKWALVGATHKQITTMSEEHIQENTQKAEDVFFLLQMPNVYDDNNKNQENNPNITEAKKHAYKQLLRMNVEMDKQLKRHFDFSIWSAKSLEHIQPQSKFNELEWTDNLSVHCIGNLVLLYGRDNSSFGAKEFSEKKNKLFNPNKAEDDKEKSLIKSMSLLHTVSVFANEKWEFAQIEENQKNFLEEFRKTYELGGKL